MNLENILAEDRKKIGQIIGQSSWYTLDQDRIQGFADVTGDQQFIHVDPVAAASGPFGGTIAHGYLTLSLTATMAPEALGMRPGQGLFINYGFDRLRFLSPVPSGARVRGIFRLMDVSLRGPGQILDTLEVTVEIEGAEKPALIATWLTLAVF